MSLATAIKDTMQARGLTTAEVARRLGEGQDRATFYRMLNGATREPRLGTLVRLCLALEISPSELLDLARLWSTEAPGQATPADLRLRGAFAQVRALPEATQHRVAPLVEALAGAWVADAREVDTDATDADDRGDAGDGREARPRGTLGRARRNGSDAAHD